ncbi:sterol 3-beta-glucosyltransferase UGT80B1 isoform X2 [Diospyros lotus]|uniref:sterol 3-beta-glucosyltransferase UGT80B1 isoform X2 n=1 Tax=Diospyros lotus TaxID=55363 RepID=UPI002253536A|nr:sterol 3-beta-glucosyltransferase UGT80B1 isoform X2 [Diospyros lotus]
METKSETTRTKPLAVFMAFGTKGDVYPIAAIAAAFACDEEQYHVVLITHSAHKNLIPHLAAKNVEYLPVSAPPVLSPYDNDDFVGTVKPNFSLQKKRITGEHRQECVLYAEQLFGDCPSLENDFIVMNFFALEGWSLAELFRVRCIVAAPYVIPYSAPSSFECYFRKELPLLYKYLEEAPANKVGWKDVIHWLWPLFTEDWALWRSVELKLSPWPFMDPVTGLPMWHDRSPSPLLLYGFSKEVVECPGYWPSNIRVCGFWFLPLEWQFSCNKCGQISALISSGHLNTKYEMCSVHAKLESFLKTPALLPPVFIGLSSVGSMGFLRNPQAFLGVLQTVLDITSHRFILFSAGFELLDAAIKKIATDMLPGSEQRQLSEDGISLFGGRLFCFSRSVPYKWLFQRCAAAVHHGGSGSTAAALHAGIPQVVCPFMLDQFYWAERMFWLGVAPEPLKKDHLLPDENDEMRVREGANMVAGAINYALSPEVKAHATEIAERLSLEDGVSEALKILKEEINCSNSTKH